MDLENLTQKEKDVFYLDLIKNREFLEGFPYLQIPDKKAYFQEKDPTQKPSFFKKLYHTLIN